MEEVIATPRTLATKFQLETAQTPSQTQFVLRHFQAIKTINPALEVVGTLLSSEEVLTITSKFVRLKLLNEVHLILNFII